MIYELGKENSVLNHFISELRNVNIQNDRMRFRRNLERIGEIFAYEISKTMDYEEVEVTTPLGLATTFHMAQQPVIGSIMRAGLPFHHGLLNYFDQGDSSFISAYRKHHKDGSFDIQVEYVASPNLDNRILILSDPMLATGSSMVLTYKALLRKGLPKHTHFVSVIASAEGLDYAKKHLPENSSLWIGVIDDELTAQSYIVPGLGDAGDLAYGEKL
jgi:uracil phosphoribosyltransferase